VTGCPGFEEEVEARCDGRRCSGGVVGCRGGCGEEKKWKWMEMREMREMWDESREWVDDDGDGDDGE
jgi:hypothetical protein